MGPVSRFRGFSTYDSCLCNAGKLGLEYDPTAEQTLHKNRNATRSNRRKKHDVFHSQPHALFSSAGRQHLSLSRRHFDDTVE